MYFVLLDSNKLVTGCFTIESNGEKFCNELDKESTIKIDDKLFEYLIFLPGQKQFVGIVDERVLTIADKDLLQSYIVTEAKIPSLEERIIVMEKLLLEVL